MAITHRNSMTTNSVFVVYGTCSGLCGLLKVHYDTLKCRFHLSLQSDSLSRQFWSWSQFEMELTGWQHFVSSAKRKTLQEVIASGRSFMYMYTRNRRGPKILPCGTPVSTINGYELLPIRKVAAEPREKSSRNANTFELRQQFQVRHSVKCLAKVKVNTVNLADTLVSEGGSSWCDLSKNRTEKEKYNHKKLW